MSDNQSELKLLDLVDRDTLQRIQDAFSAMTGMAALTTDENGTAVTDGSAFTDYCMKYTRCTPLGKRLCEQCDKFGSEQALALGKASTYYCHSGLIDFAAPIMADGKRIGSFIGGQVLTKAPQEDKIKETALELGVDPDLFWEAAQKVTIHPKAEIDRAASFLETISGVLSDIAYGKYLAKTAAVELERTSSMKTDFLANMSHEIRTPMNAVIGMAEMALREEMSPAARDYINQIKSSGRALLNIINDILDYSKIESGKMELSPVEYEPLSLFNDVASIVMTRLTDKDVELLLDIDPNIPHTLIGDDLRIRQIIINLANNATKFTNHGHVQLVARYEQIDDDNVMLKVAINDTGIGIKKEDLGKLFNSFQQVDSKRNRNVEGTGLGLAISKNFISMMGGTIGVESEYEVGSTFHFEIPQRIAEKRPSIKLDHPDKYVIAGFFGREDVQEDFCSDAAKLGVRTDVMTGSENPKSSVDSWLNMNKDKETYILVEQSIFSEEVMSHVNVDEYPNVHAILLADAFADVRQWNHLPYLQIMKKPLSVLNLAAILESENVNFGGLVANESESSFVAPDATVLIVDDNPVNLTVAEGLLDPLNMKVHTAQSGMDALKKIEETRYDIIFMDHMMPQMDGVETTRVIRRLHPECNETPIIALTANAVSGMKEVFLAEGMNDFIAKPIEVKVLINKVRQWLPPEKIQKASGEEKAESDKNKETSSDTMSVPDKIGDLNLESALSLLGSPKLFWKVCKDYYRVITSKADLIEQYYNNKDWPNYVIEVHALKSASKQIGAETLSKVAADMEAAGNARDTALMDKFTMDMVNKYRSYATLLAPYFEEKAEDTDKPMISDDELKAFFDRMLEAIDNLDIVEMGNVIEEMSAFALPDDKKESFEKLENAVADIDVDVCEEIVKNW